MRLLREYLRKRDCPRSTKTISACWSSAAPSNCPRPCDDDIDDGMELTARNTGHEARRGAELWRPRRDGGRLQRHPRSRRRRNGHGRRFRVDEQTISRHLYTAGLPDPDLLIRTSGEMRVSNFLLWQIAYAEIYVTETLWPDFRRGELSRRCSITRSANAATAGWPRSSAIRDGLPPG